MAKEVGGNSMTVSPAMMHRASVESSVKDGSTGVTACHSNEYRAIQHLLHADLRRLSKIPSKLKRNELKGELTAEYESYIQPVVVSGDCGKSNEVFSTILVWCVDAMLLDQALKMLPVALASGLNSPRGFKKRRLSEIVVEDISKSVIEHQEPGLFKASLLTLENAVSDVCLPDYIRAKLYKALGFSVMKESATESVKYFGLSYTYNPKGGVGALLKRYQKLTGTLPPSEKKPRNIMKRVPKEALKFDLSIRQAARMVGVSYQTFCKIVLENPTLFSCYKVPYGKGYIKRYRTDEVQDYIREHIVQVIED